MTDEKSKKSESVDLEARAGAKATLQAIAGIKTPSVKEANQVQTIPEAKIQAVKTKTEPEGTKSTPETKPQKAPKEADPNKEFVDGIMTEMNLKGASKKRLIKMLAEQLNFDKQKVMFKLKRALITERYAAAHADAGH